jgi:hypothetical protein
MGKGSKHGMPQSSPKLAKSNQSGQRIEQILHIYLSGLRTLPVRGHKPISRCVPDCDCLHEILSSCCACKLWMFG